MCTSKVSKEAKIGKNVKIGDFCKIYSNVVIEDDCIIEDYCSIGIPSRLSEGMPLVIKRESHIRSYSAFYEGSEFGEELVTGHRVTVREKTVAGKGFQIGTLSDLQGHQRIGDYVKTHSNVHIGQGTEIEDYCWIFPYVVFTNDPHPPSDGCHVGCKIEKYAVIATHACLMPGVRVGSGALVAAGALVVKDVEEGHIVAGVPAKDMGLTEKIILRDGKGKPAYPWRRHFHRGYPKEVVEEWLKEFSEG